MNRNFQIRTLAATLTAAAALSISAQSIPAGYALAYLPSGQPVLVQTSNVPHASPAVNSSPAPASYVPAVNYAPAAPVSPAPNPYPGMPTYVGQGAGTYGQPRRVMLPAGLTVFVRTAQALRSNVLQPGQTFDCYLDAPLYQGEIMIADRGARVEARIVDATAAGKISGQSGLALQLFRLTTADGKTLDIHTTTQTLAGGTSYGKDAARIATGAAVGALIGGLTGGGKGAAIGAGVGAGGGTIWTLKTAGPQVVIPSESLLQFQLVTPTLFTTW